ncbi:MAG: PAS domain-containing protein [Acidimicrobiales bacterium]
MNDTTDDEVAPGHTNLVSSRALGSEFIDAAPGAILVVRSDGTIAVANHQALDLFGYRHEELVGSPVELLVPPSSRSVTPNTAPAISKNLASATWESCRPSSWGGGPTGRSCRSRSG